MVRGLRHIPGLRAFYHWLTDKRSEILPPPPETGGSALELGCATGRFLERLRNAGWQAKGIELVPEAAARARNRGFTVHEGTLESFPFPDESFDAVFAWMVVEHLPDPAGTLRELHRILRPDGRLYFSVPNFGCWERYIFRSNWWALELPRHLQHFTPATIRQMLRDTGFDQPAIIHQQNALNIISSLGIVLRRIGLKNWGDRCIAFTDNPTMGWQLALAPPAKVLAWIRQGGRLTIATRKLRPASDSPPSVSGLSPSCSQADPPQEAGST